MTLVSSGAGSHLPPPRHWQGQTQPAQRTKEAKSKPKAEEETAEKAATSQEKFFWQVLKGTVEPDFVWGPFLACMGRYGREKEHLLV